MLVAAFLLFTFLLSLSDSHVIIIGAVCNEGSLSFPFFDSLKHHCRYCKLERVCHAADHVDISCNGEHAIWVGLTLCASCQIGWLRWGRRHPPFFFLPIPSLLSCPQPPSLVFPRCCFLSRQCKWVATCSLKSTSGRFSSMGQNITIKNTLLFPTTRAIDWLWVYQLVVSWSENFVFLDRQFPKERLLKMLFAWTKWVPCPFKTETVGIDGGYMQNRTKLPNGLSLSLCMCMFFHRMNMYC